MSLPKIIDCRPEAILKEIAPVQQKFALIFFNMEPGRCYPDSENLLHEIDCIFGESDIKIWLDEHQLMILSCDVTGKSELSMAVEKVQDIINCKAGIVFYPEDGRSLQALTFKAYEASCLHVNTGIKRALNKAMDDNEFFLEYQPQIDTQTGKHIGVEALIRWQSQTQGKVIMPFEFLPIAEAEGMMDQICRWTLYEASRQSLAWQAQGNIIRISVNISTTYLLNPDFLMNLDQVIEDTGVDPTLLELEITENKGINSFNVDTVNAVIQAVRKKGIVVSLDDFGMEYNSLEILRVLTVDRIKIDKVFVQNIENEKVRVIVQATIGIAHAIGLECIAEGVETIRQATLLEKMGCFHMQGFLYGRPQKGFPKWRTVSSI